MGDTVKEGLHIFIPPHIHQTPLKLPQSTSIIPLQELTHPPLKIRQRKKPIPLNRLPKPLDRFLMFTEGSMDDGDVEEDFGVGGGLGEGVESLEGEGGGGGVVGEGEGPGGEFGAEGHGGRMRMSRPARGGRSEGGEGLLLGECPLTNKDGAMFTLSTELIPSQDYY